MGETSPKRRQEDGWVRVLRILRERAEALIDKLGPEYYFKLMDGLEQVDPRSSGIVLLNRFDLTVELG